MSKNLIPKGTPDEKPSWLEKVTVSIELVTPEKVDKWLENSPAFNRGIGKRVVFRYATAMNDKRWAFTGESIIFDSGELDKEVLLDGWHRTHAVKESGIAQWFVVVRGVPREAFHYIDHGRGRAFRDTLLVLGNTNSAIVAAACSYLTGYLKLGRFTTNGMEDHERWITYQDYRELDDLCEHYNRGRNVPLKGVPPGLLTAVHVVLSRKDTDAASEFMDLVVLGDDLEADHPITQFRSYVRKQMSYDLKPTNLPGKFGAGLLKAWNLYRNNERVSKFVVPTTVPEPI